MYKKLLDKIKQYNKITLFRHQRPDGDAIFTMLALYEFIRTNFPDKKVKCCGYDLYSKKNKNDKVSDSFIKSSLAIVIDTSRSDRIDDDRFALAEYIIKIDHHPVVDSYGNLNIVKTDVGACAELLSEILMSKAFSKYKISNKVYEYLYSGIVTDTLNLKTASTTPKTLKIASILAEKGNLIISNIVDSLMDNSIDEFQKISKLRNHLKIDKNFGYIILHNKDLKEIGFDPYEAKNNISEFGTISDLNVWAFAVEIDGKYDISCRSKRGYIINKISQRYGGGGHPNATGIKNLNKKELNNLFHELIELSTKKPVKQ